MKRQLTNLVSGGLLSIFFATTTTAQEQTFKELPPVTITAGSPSTVVNAKINNAFAMAFLGATNIRWYEIDKKFLVKFILNDQENRALFTKGGEIVYHISYGTEKNLPGEVRKLVKSNYYDHNITRILKISQDGRVIWVVHLEDDKEFFLVRVENLELEETKRIEKTK